MTRVSPLILIFCLFIGDLTMHANEKKNSGEYLIFVDEITSIFKQEMKQKYGLHCYARGESMPYDVEKFNLSFMIQRHATIEEARRMEVFGVEKLLKLINGHEKIRPYLREYSFKPDRVGISISFQTKTGERPLDGSVAHVYATRNKIFYSKADIVITKPHPHTDLTALGGPVTTMIGGGASVELVDLMEESYEEALKIVEQGGQS